MSQRPSANVESGSSLPARNGSVFTDYSFRLSKLYTVLDKSKSSSVCSKAKTSPQHVEKQRPSHGTAASRFNTLAPIPWKVQSSGNKRHEATKGGERCALTRDRSRNESESSKVVAINLLRNPNLVQPEILPMFVGSVGKNAETATVVGAEVVTSPEKCPSYPKLQSADKYPQVAVGLHICKPKTDLYSLFSPAMGAEVDVNMDGSNIFSKSDALTQYSLASGTLPRLRTDGSGQGPSVSSDSPAYERLYDLWNKRLAMRKLFTFRNELESFIYDNLGNLANSIVSQEEYTWKQCDLEKQGTVVFTRNVFINPKLLNLAADDMTSLTGIVYSSGSGAPGMHSLKISQDDISQNSGQHSNLIPAHKMESFFLSLLTQLHEKTVTLLQTYPMRFYTYTVGKNAEEKDDSDGATSFNSLGKGACNLPCRKDEGNLMTQEKLYLLHNEKEYINQLLQMEQHFVKNAVLNGTITPAVVSLPEEIIIKPLMVLETATSVALIWQALRQCAASVPDVGFAMELFHNYLLPHVYVNFALYSSVLPSNGTLSEQIVRLSEIPLRSSMRLLSEDATQQCRKDTQYMESVLQHWALRSWRRWIIGYRRRLTSLELVSKMLLRVRWRLRLQKVMGAWRLTTIQGKQESYFDRIRKKYNSIVNSSCASVESKFFQGSSIMTPSTVSLQKEKNSIKSESNTALTRSRFLAIKLTEKTQQAKKTSSNAATPSIEEVTSRAPRRIEHLKTKAQRKPVDQESNASSSAYQTTVESLLDKPVASENSTKGKSEERDTPASREAFDNSSAVSTATASPIHSEVQPSLFISPSCEQDALPQDSIIEMIMDMQQKESEMCMHLRSEIAIQRRRIQMLERERNGLRERNRTLESDLVRTVEEKLYYCNLFQKKQFQLMDKDKQIIQLRSRLRAHRTRPWQRVTMRIAGELCGASTQVSEAADERHVHSDLKKTDEVRDPEGKEKASKAHSEEPDKSLGDKFQRESDSQKEDDNSSFHSSEGRSNLINAQATREAEEERLFGELAPIVLSSTRELPSAMTILQDWANSCLDDLESLDDLKGGALSLRFRSFSEEMRSGVLLSRLLFYLALPRYLQRNANNDERSNEAIHAGASAVMDTKDGKDDKSKYIDSLYAEVFVRRRQQLLEQRNVQLDAPFPVYSECFGDLLNMVPTDRMAMLLHFASQILNDSTSVMSDVVALKRQQVLNIVSSTTGFSLPPSVPTIDLHEVVDPHALVMGERSSTVTLIAILYVRFSHPFNHKARQSAIVEREAILYLLNPRSYTGSTTSRHLQSPRSETEEKNSLEQDSRLPERQRSQHALWIEDEILDRLIDEDKSPWQLFKERCVPIFGSSAHPFLLRGNFWPSEAFESPQLANLLGELGMALNRSLQIHRWHILFSCLIPVTNYSRVSRGVFTGPRASPVALRVGMEQEGVPLLPSLNSNGLERLYAKRKHCVMAICSPGVDSKCVSPIKGLMPSSSDWKSTYVACEKQKLKEVLGVATNDIINLFLWNASLQPEMALPAMDLSEWRSFCVDLGIVKLQQERGKSEDSRNSNRHTKLVKSLELNFVSEIFYKAGHFHADRNLSSFTSSKKHDQHQAGAFCSISELSASFDKFSDVLGKERLDNNNEKNFMQSCELNIFDCASSIGVDDSKKRTDLSNKMVSSHLHSTLLSEYLMFPGFVTALILLVDALYDPLPPEIAPASLAADKSKRRDDDVNGEEASYSPPIVWLGDAITQFLNDYALREDSVRFEKTPHAFLKRIQMGIQTQEVLTKYSSALLLVYQNYSKVVYGVICMQEESLLQLMRDAMLTSTETTQYLISEIFQKCSTVCKSVEENAIAVCRDINGKPREKGNNKLEFRIPSSRIGASSNPHAGATDLLSPNSVGSFAISNSKFKRHEVQVLTLDGFNQFLCVLCHFKQPNPLTPLHQRLEIFLRRSVLRPLSRKIENLSMLLKRQDS
ncbi:unnamed protein product [Phytomonas sp. Hart1]|nr:unnamed protein product [Phytomonas sp. Hart1]|eukprot:CCW67678.1 unnamed protein product [Phytomonas sp. isolate Hart1]